jgi:3-phenylpropionate/trans-cinnamate dioxygenase ferredoxin reductase subunit
MTCIAGKNGKLSHVELADGEQLPADLAVVGIGMLPNAKLAECGSFPQMELHRQ